MGNLINAALADIDTRTRQQTSIQPKQKDTPCYEPGATINIYEASPLQQNPDDSSQVIARVTGTSATVIKRLGKYYYVDCKGVKGYLNSYYIVTK